MRRFSYSKNYADVAILALTKQQISKDILRKYNLDSLYIRGRIAASEENIDDITSDWKLSIEDVSSENISNEIIQLMKGELKYDTETAQSLNFICENTPSVIPSLNTKKRIGDSISF